MPTLDGGSAFPLSTAFTNGVRSTVTQTGVTTNGAGLIVISLPANGQNGQFAYSSVTVGAANATAIKQLTWQAGQSFPGAGTAEIWAYWSTGALNNVTVTATHGVSGSASSELITVWAFIAASVKDGSSSIATCFGALGGFQQDASRQVSADLTGVLSTSVVIGSFLDGASGGGLTALGNTNWRGSSDDGTFGCSLRTSDSSSISGSVTVGASTSTTFMASAAAEVFDLSGVTQTDTAVASDIEDAASYYLFDWFQGNAFQSNAFAILGGQAGNPLGLSASEQDNAQASDSQSAQKHIPSLLQQDNAQANDQEAYALGLGYGVGPDSAQASDAEAVAVLKNVAQTDSAQASDSADAQKYLPSLSQTDNAQANDAEAYALGLGYGQTDSALASDAEAFTWAGSSLALMASQEDDALASDSEAIALVKNVAQTDSAQASDSEDISLVKNVAQSDTALASDSEAIAILRNVAQSDTALASDTESAQNYLPGYSQSDTALASDVLAFAIASAGTVVGSFSDAVQAGDVEALALVKNVAQSDSAVALDGLAFTLNTGSAGVDQSDTARASDAFAVANSGGGISIFGVVNIWNGAAWVRWNGSTWV